MAKPSKEIKIEYNFVITPYEGKDIVIDKVKEYQVVQGVMFWIKQTDDTQLWFPLAKIATIEATQKVTERLKI